MQQIDRILRQAELCRVTGLSRSTLYRFERDGRLPHSIQLGQRAKGWRESDIARWIAEGGAVT